MMYPLFQNPRAEESPLSTGGGCCSIPPAQFAVGHGAARLTAAAALIGRNAPKKSRSPSFGGAFPGHGGIALPPIRSSPKAPHQEEQNHEQKGGTEEEEEEEEEEPGGGPSLPPPMPPPQSATAMF